MFADEAIRFQDRLVELGVTVPAEDVRSAIEWGLDRLREREGFTTYPDMVYGDYWWALIEDDVIDYLHNDFGIEYDVFAGL